MCFTKSNNLFIEYSNGYAIIRMRLFYCQIIATQILFLFIFPKAVILSQ